MVAFDLDNEQLRKLFTDAFKPKWRGTCEVCGEGDRELDESLGVLMCLICRNTITFKLKDTQHPFEGVRLVMDPTQRGQGKPGHKVPLELSELLKEFYRDTLLNSVRAKTTFNRFIEAHHQPLSFGRFLTDSPPTE